MGLTRKFLSISTLGIIPYRNREERQAAYARQTRNAARASVALEAAQLQELRGIRTGVDHGNVREEGRDIVRTAGIYGTTARPGFPRAGWYHHPKDEEGVARYWDGGCWTDHRMFIGSNE